MWAKAVLLHQESVRSHGSMGDSACTELFGSAHLAIVDTHQGNMVVNTCLRNIWNIIIVGPDQKYDYCRYFFIAVFPGIAGQTTVQRMLLLFAASHFKPLQACSASERPLCWICLVHQWLAMRVARRLLAARRGRIAHYQEFQVTWRQQHTKPRKLADLANL